jgi:hypothetical protein
VTACGQATLGSGSGGASELSPEAAEAALIEAMVNREAIGMRASGLTFAELFPQAGQSEVLADAFRADVVAVEAGRAFGGSLDDDPLGELPFDDPQADWRSFHVRVEVVEVFSGDVTVGQELTIGLAFGSGLEMEVVSAGLMSMGNIVVFTAPGHFFLPYDSSTPVVWNGAFLSPVEGDRVPFPAVSEGGGEASLVSRLDTLPELRKVP